MRVVKTQFTCVVFLACLKIYYFQKDNGLYNQLTGRLTCLVGTIWRKISRIKKFTFKSFACTWKLIAFSLKALIEIPAPLPSKAKLNLKFSTLVKFWAMLKPLGESTTFIHLPWVFFSMIIISVTKAVSLGQLQGAQRLLTMKSWVPCTYLRLNIYKFFAVTQWQKFIACSTQVLHLR